MIATGEYRGVKTPSGALHLLALQLQAKRAEEAARRALGDSLTGPRALVPSFHRTWSAARDAEKLVHKEIRRSTRRTVLQFIPRAAR